MKEQQQCYLESPLIQQHAAVAVISFSNFWITFKMIWKLVVGENETHLLIHQLALVSSINAVQFIRLCCRVQFIIHI